MIFTLNEGNLIKRYLKKISSSQIDIYFTPEYYYLYENYNDGKALFFVFEKNDEIALYPFLLNPINELGYNLDNLYSDIQGAYGYNGVISSTEDKAFIEKFYNEFNLYCTRNNIISEFTRFHPILNNHVFSKDYLEVIYDRETVILDLTKSFNEIWKNEYSGTNRNMIRKAKDNEVIIEFNESLNGLLKFADLYRETMDDLNSDNYYKFDNSYFENIFHLLKSNYDLVMAYKNDELIAASLFLYYGNFYHYHLSARNREYQKYAANNLILDKAIKKAQERGCKKFHFGGGFDKIPQNSLLKFKSNFSSQRGKFYIGKKIHNKEVYNKVIKQWAEKNPNYEGNNNQILLRYRNH